MRWMNRQQMEPGGGGGGDLSAGAAAQKAATWQTRGRATLARWKTSRRARFQDADLDGNLKNMTGIQ